jgi:hypothetical protein
LGLYQPRLLVQLRPISRAICRAGQQFPVRLVPRKNLPATVPAACKQSRFVWELSSRNAKLRREAIRMNFDIERSARVVARVAQLINHRSQENRHLFGWPCQSPAPPEGSAHLPRQAELLSATSETQVAEINQHPIGWVISRICPRVFARRPDRPHLGWKTKESRRILSGPGRIRMTPNAGDSNMARHLFFAITLLCIGVLNSPVQAVLDAARCEDQAANCQGRCANPSGGTGHNNCINRCDRQVNICLIRAHDVPLRRIGR